MSNMRKFIQAAKQTKNTDNQIAGLPDDQIVGLPDNQQAVKPTRRKTKNTDNQIAGLPDNQVVGLPDSQIARLPEEKMVNLCVRVPESMRRHWAAEAKRAGVTMTEVIMEALNQKFGLPDNQ